MRITLVLQPPHEHSGDSSAWMYDFMYRPDHHRYESPLKELMLLIHQYYYTNTPRCVIRAFRCKAPLLNGPCYYHQIETLRTASRAFSIISWPAIDEFTHVRIKKIHRYNNIMDDWGWKIKSNTLWWQGSIHQSCHHSQTQKDFWLLLSITWYGADNWGETSNSRILRQQFRNWCH